MLHFLPPLVLCVIAFTSLQIHTVTATNATLHLLTNTTNGAACLDGSPPGYWHREGDSGTWVIHFQGGGWCYGEADCRARAASPLGSSAAWPASIDTTAASSCSNVLCCCNGGILSDNEQENPHLYDSTLVFIGYCDGSSYSSMNNDVHTVMQEDGTETKLYFRGRHNLDSILIDLIRTRNLLSAKRIIVTGCSAGGLAVYLHLDYIRSLIPRSIEVVGMSDAGFFMDLPDLAGEYLYRNNLLRSIPLWNHTSGVNSDCIAYYSSADSWRCMFAPYTLPFISTPLFIVQSQYDCWQLQNIINLPCIGWTGSPDRCNATERLGFESLRTHMIEQLQQASTHDGIWNEGCTTHCQSLLNGYAGGNAWTKLLLNGESPSTSFEQWLSGTGGSSARQFDQPWPTNHFCEKAAAYWNKPTSYWNKQPTQMQKHSAP